MPAGIRVRGVEQPRAAPLEGADTYALRGIRGYGVENRRFRSENPQGFGVIDADTFVPDAGFFREEQT